MLTYDQLTTGMVVAMGGHTTAPCVIWRIPDGCPVQVQPGNNVVVGSWGYTGQDDFYVVGQHDRASWDAMVDRQGLYPVHIATVDLGQLPSLYADDLLDVPDDWHIKHCAQIAQWQAHLLWSIWASWQLDGLTGDDYRTCLDDILLDR